MQQPGLLKTSQHGMRREPHANFHQHFVDAIKEIATVELTSSLRHMFSHVDDYLFDLAEKAGSGQEKLRYFDTMRELRLRKNRIISEFFTCFYKRFTEQLLRKNRDNDYNVDKFSKLDAVHIELLANETLEINVAVNSMKERLRGEFFEDLSALARRFEVILDHTYDVDSVPLSPKVLCHALSDVINEIDVGLQIKLIIFKIFDRYVLRSTGRLYKKVNDYFIKKGVLPVLRDSAAMKRPVIFQQFETPDKINYLPANNGVNAPVIEHFYKNYDEDVFGALQDLLHAKAKHNLSANNYNKISEKSTEEVPSVFLAHDVLTALTLMQERVSNLSDVDCETLSCNIKDDLISHLQVISEENKLNHLGESDEDVIDIVNLMFDFILADETLPHMLRTLISRLQIPIIKLAMLDSSFFGNKSHAARQLLNELAYSANIMQNKEVFVIADNDPVYLKIKEIVDVILNEFSVNTEIFGDQLRVLQAFIRQYLKEKKADARRLEECKNIVVSELKKKLNTQKVPEVVELFVKNVWNDVLTMIGIRDGCSGSAWEDALRIVDDLVWSVQPKLLVQERQHLIRMIPRLLNRLQEGLCFINYGQSQIDNFFIHMESLHLGCMKGMDGAALMPLNDESEQIPGSNSIENIVLESDQHSNYEYDLSDDTINKSPNFQIVANMQKGIWVEFFIGKSRRKGKLAWKCEFTGEYSFVDRNYTVVQHLNLRKLVNKFDKREAVIVEDIPLFDRAVDAVIVGLQQCGVKLAGIQPA